ncbi:retrovirus-related Pol polyprotein from transposon 17.6 [Trichonephila clavipes]|nr:retrovirus-related Pol polyprotein from transposon 17.6 [Trichonephila clavipes]
MAFLGKGKKQDMLQLAEELGINATLNMTVPSIKIAITNSEGYEEEFVKNLYETIIANGKKIGRGSVNGHEIDILRDTGATIDLVCAKYINPSSFSGENVWVKQPLSPELVCLPLAVVEISGNFGTVQTKAAVCGNHLNQHGRYLLGNKTAELIKGNLGYNFLPVEILNAVQTRSQVKAAREERGIDSGDAKKGEDEVIIVSSDAEDEILIPALQEYVPELALLRVTRENLIDAQKIARRLNPYTNRQPVKCRLPISVTNCIARKCRVYTVRVGVWENLRTPETLVMEHWMEPEEEGDLVTEYMFKLINRLKRCQEVAINKMEEMQVKRKTWYSGLLPKIYKSVLGNCCPLTDALKGRAKKGEIKWTTECENAFRELKRKLTEKPVLYAPNFEREFIVQTDASNAGMGAVLTQLTEQGEEHPILYLSKKFSEVEKRYCTTEKECASIVFAIKRLHYYLDGNSFLVMTDHNPLVWLNRNVSSNPRLMRWALALQPYNFRIVHRSGKSHKNADSLSRSVIDN